MIIVNKCEVITDFKLAKNVFNELSDIFPINVLASNKTPLKIELIDNEVITTGKGQQFRTILNYNPYLKNFKLNHLNNKNICTFTLKQIKKQK